MSGARTSPFDQWTDRDLVNLVAAYPLAWLVSGNAPLLSTPLPMLLETDGAGRPTSLLGHFALSNPQVEVIRAEPTTLFLFTGPHAYVSPELITSTRNWGPTWNYAIARVTAEVRFDEGLNDEALAALVAAMEHGREKPWSAAELGQRYKQMKRHIIAFRARIIDVAARFKLGQDERPDVLSDIVAGFDDGDLASWMRRFNADRL